MPSHCCDFEVYHFQSKPLNIAIHPQAYFWSFFLLFESSSWCCQKGGGKAPDKFDA